MRKKTTNIRYFRILTEIYIYCFLFILTIQVHSQITNPTFSHTGGIYNQAFSLTLQTTGNQGSIIYTTDGSYPTLTNGTTYKSALTINKTTIIRAIAVISGQTTGKATTRSFIFPDDVIRQSNTPTGYPVKWGPYTGIAGNATADYEMDPELMNDALKAASVKQSFTKIPILSLVTDRNNLFSSVVDSVSGGIYMYTGAPITNFTYATGRDWERPVSMELYNTNATSMQVDCGLRIQGGHGRRPEKSPKHSFILNFDSIYGVNSIDFPVYADSKITKFEKLILRAGFGNSWTHQEHAQRSKATYLEDSWTKDTQRSMGHIAGQSKHIHLFLNGLYWGIYALSERMDDDFAENYLGGEDDEFDVIKDYAEVADGEITAWNKMMSMANAGLESTKAYMEFQGKNPDGTFNPAGESMADVVNLADYMLINFYGGNTDWDHHNWAAIRNRINPEKGFKFLCWDAEMMLSSVNVNVLAENNDNCPSRIFQQLMKNSIYQRIFADRIQKHCFHDGKLTPDSSVSRWLRKKNILEDVIDAESARWGDYRRDVHRYMAAGPFSLYNKTEFWTPQNNFIQNSFFPQRNAAFIAQLRTAGWFPGFDAPIFQINGIRTYQTRIKKNDLLSMTAEKGIIYYAVDGEDPLDIITGTLKPSAKQYSGPLSLNYSTRITARVFNNGEWSAANSRYYLIPSELKQIKITEIHYHPLPGEITDDSEYEFIEIKNTGKSYFDLSGTAFTKGISFTFPGETMLSPGQILVLASKSNVFNSRYQFRPFGEFSGKLNNAGEELLMQHTLGDTIINFTYADIAPWPFSPDGSGYSLVPVSANPTNNQTNPLDWRASSTIGGSPGKDDQLFSAISNPDNKSNILVKAYPNPFESEVHISANIPSEGIVKITIFNISGQKIISLDDVLISEGKIHATWNGCDASLLPVPDGVYFYQLIQNNQILNMRGKLIKTARFLQY